MSKVNFSEDFKRDAVSQITERGYPVAEVSRRLGVSQHSLYAWKKKLGTVSSGDDGKDTEIRRLKRELMRVTEERDILNGGKSDNDLGDHYPAEATAYFARDAK